MKTNAYSHSVFSKRAIGSKAFMSDRTMKAMSVSESERSLFHVLDSASQS